MHSRSLARAVVALAAVLSVACGGGGGRGALEHGVYRDGPVAFRIPEVPATWRRVDVTDAALAFHDDAHDASVLINGRCGPADEGTPLEALTNHLLIGSTERVLEEQEKEAFDGREVLRSVVRAKVDGVELRFVLFVFKKDGCVYDFVFAGPPDGVAQGRRAFEGVVRGFRTVAGSGSV